jgi:hypothetical protein
VMPALQGRTPLQAWLADPTPLTTVPAADLRLLMLDDDGRTRKITTKGVAWRAPQVTAAVAGQIRAGVAHPVIAAGIAVALITGVQALALASTPRDALSPGDDALQLTWQPPGRTLIPAGLAAAPRPAATAVFHVPAAARPLLQAARHFSRSAPGRRPARRLFAATPFTNDRIGAAAASCKIPLPGQPNLAALWQTGITCTRTAYLGTRFDSSFNDDQDFEPGRGPGTAAWREDRRSP